jgi:hypothetical protein
MRAFDFSQYAGWVLPYSPRPRRQDVDSGGPEQRTTF